VLLHLELVSKHQFESQWVLKIILLVMLAETGSSPNSEFFQVNPPHPSTFAKEAPDLEPEDLIHVETMLNN
jgi:hypothetical protein